MESDMRCPIHRKSPGNALLLLSSNKTSHAMSRHQIDLSIKNKARRPSSYETSAVLKKV
jgi:hypothetical protein